MQKGIAYNTVVQVAGGLGPYQVSVSDQVVVDGNTFAKPEQITLTKISPDKTKMSILISIEGQYYIHLKTIDAIGNEAEILLQISIVDYCSDKPYNIRNTSEKSPAVMVKESWHQTNMLKLLPGVLREQ